MKNIKLEKLSLESYVKLNVIGALVVGLGMGILAFITSIFSPESVTATIGDQAFTGIKAGIAGIFLFPFIMSIIFSIFSVLLYLGLNFYLKFKKNINIKIKISDDNKKI